MQYRTDLALEQLAEMPQKQGITEHKRGEHFRITEIYIPDDASGRHIGRGKGRYITLEGQSLSRFSDDYRCMASELAAELRPLLPETGCVLVAGLGNQDITPDALGPRTTANVLATRHLRDALSAEDADFLKALRPVCVLAGGVLGQTGIESAELLKAVADHVHPTAVIAVDALACSALERLGTTIQISDTGIAPGSGVANHRLALTAEGFGVPVIGMGVPTVIGMRTAVEDLTGQRAQIPQMMVTPRDVDRLIQQAAHLMGCGINLALHPEMEYEDVVGLMG